MRNQKNSNRRVEQLSQPLLEDSAEQLRMALSAAQMGMWDWNILTGEIKWSPEHEKLFGLTHSAFDGNYQTFDACLHPDDRETVNQAVQQALQTHSSYHCEFRVVWLDGSIHWIEGRGQAFYNEAEQPVRMAGTVMAIDERKQAQGLLEQQFEQQRLVMEMTQRIRRSLNLQDILQTTVEEVRRLLKTDRVIIFQFSPGWRGTVVVESVGVHWRAILSTEIYDPCFGENYVEPYKQGLVTLKSDIYDGEIDPCHVQLLANFQVRANLVVPIIKGEELWGLLIAHHCAAPREWQSSEIVLLRHLAAQVSVALQQSALFEQVQTELTERKQAEQTLAKELLRIQTLFNTSFDGIVILDLPGNVIEANPRFAQMLGYTPEETAKLNIADWEAQFTDEELQQLMGDYINLKYRVLETRHRRKDGSIYDVEISTSVLEWDGEILRFCVCRDISDRKQAEMALQQLNAELEQRVAQRTAQLTQVNERLLKALMQQHHSQLILLEQAQLLDLAHDTILTRDLNDVITFWNEGAQQMYGWTKAEALGQKIHTFLQTQFPQPLVEIESELLERGYWQGELIHTRRTGSTLTVASRWVMQKDEMGRPIKVLEINNDITVQKQAEAALQQHVREIEDLYNKAPCGYHSLDAEGNLIRINETELNWLGYSREQILHQKFSDFVTPESQLVVQQNFLKFQEQGWINNLEFEIVGKDGTTRWISLNATAINDEAGNFVMSCSTLFDISDRKRAEEMLNLQAVITRNMAEGICLVRADNGVIVYANPKFEQMFGYDSGELNGQHASTINYASERVTAEAVNQAIRAAVLQNGESTYEIHNVKKDGTPFWCSATTSVFHHTDYGDVLVAVHQDITERKQAEVALQQQARQEQLLWCITQAIRQSLDLNVILDTTVTEVRQTLQVDRVAVYCFHPDWGGNFMAESVSNDWVKRVEPNIQKVWEDIYLQEIQGGRFRNQETFVVPDIYAPELQPCHIKLLEQFPDKAYVIVPIFSGKVLWGLLAIYQNTTCRNWQSWEIELLEQIASQLAIAIQQSELYGQLQIELQERKQAEAILREAERRWQSLLDNVQLIVVGLDPWRNVNYINPFFLNLTGYTDKEVIGKNWLENFLPLSDKESLQSIFSEILTHKAYPYYQTSILTKSGEERFIAWNNTLLQDSEGTIIGTISIGEDITERQKVEQMKNEFIGIVSHELRTPLTAIKMSLGLLKTGIYDKKPEKFQRMLEIALIDTNRLVNLVNDILDLERLESGRAVLEKTCCQAADLMQQAVDGVQLLATPQQITLTINPTDAKVWAAAEAIIQALTNLLSNAIKFSPANSTITLSAECQTEFVLFQVSDQGRGIPADKLEAIFGRFQQVDASDARQKGGTGLGLAICHSIIEQHGGQIWAQSTLGEGSTFFFTLPLRPEEIG